MQNVIINDMGKSKPQMLKLLKAIKDGREKLDYTIYNLEARRMVANELENAFQSEKSYVKQIKYRNRDISVED